ncbi:unnamed protein product [Gadus morhua 'NCC']|uniref:TNFR-Cys domain-containing protein n=1 Tax=Gadus morhua TaxID=8049 RepID=A0A8C5AWC6_GADMO
MSSLILCFGLLCFLDAWAVHFALSCGELQFQSAEGRCCKSCGKGKYVLVECSKDHETECLPCKPGTYKDSISPSKCQSCLTCSNKTLEQCTKTTNAKCSCSEGYMCSDEHCSKCEVKKRCQLGEKLKRKGNKDFSYECEPCPDKTYSDTHDGNCKSITQCSDSGLFEVFPGNKTHNARCSLYDAEVPYRWESTISVINLACSILLLLILLYACVKKTMRHTHANDIAVFAPVSTTTPEYPYPKEEIGEKFSICQL